MRQQIRFLTTTDGLSLAWAETGRGVPLVKASNWLTHLRYDWESPVWRHWTEFFARHFRYIRYDERGCGLTDWNVGDLSFPHWVKDLEAVVHAARIGRPFVLVGISQGAATAAAYAADHPGQVSHLILYGGYARGAYQRGDADSKSLHQAIREITRQGWGRDNSAFRRIFTSRFIPEGTEEQVSWFNDLCRKTTTAQTSAQLLEARAEIDATQFLARIKTPTLVLHARDDEVAPFEEGKLLASRIPDATFVELESCNHVLLEHEPAWAQFKEHVLDFTGVGAGQEQIRENLSRRETEILALLCRGRTNIQISGELGISEKTVRNHLSRLYEKMGVHSRTEAIVRAQSKK